MSEHGGCQSSFTIQATSELFRQDPGQMGGPFQKTCLGERMIVWSGQMGGINHLSTFDADLRNVSFALISFMGFPAILSTLQPFQMCIYNRK